MNKSINEIIDIFKKNLNTTFTELDLTVIVWVDLKIAMSSMETYLA